MAPEPYSDEAGPMSALMFSMNVSGRKESEFPARRSEMMGTPEISVLMRERLKPLML